MQINDQQKTKNRLISEIVELRQQLADMEKTVKEYQNQHETLGKTPDYAKSIFETMRESLIVLDADLKIISANASFYSTFATDPSETIGKFIYELGNREWDIPRLKTRLKEILSQNKKFDDFNLKLYFRNIGRKVMLLNACRIHDEHTGAQKILVAIKDVSERTRLEEKLAESAMTDILTGVYNRRGLFFLADKMLKLSKRKGKGIFMLYVDLDNLKMINDSYGHAEGDKVLIKSADILRKVYRESDIVARIGGDEFVVLPVGTDGDNSEKIISRLKDNLDKFNLQNDFGYKLSLSAGIAYYDPQSQLSVNELLARGDKSMYIYKKLKNETRTLLTYDNSGAYIR